jgi:hypothetical protein
MKIQPKCIEEEQDRNVEIVRLGASVEKEGRFLAEIDSF